jgi:hypothetical protein
VAGLRGRYKERINLQKKKGRGRVGGTLGVFLLGRKEARRRRREPGRGNRRSKKRRKEEGDITETPQVKGKVNMADVNKRNQRENFLKMEKSRTQRQDLTSDIFKRRETRPGLAWYVLPTKMEEREGETRGRTRERKGDKGVERRRRGREPGLTILRLEKSQKSKSPFFPLFSPSLLLVPLLQLFILLITISFLFFLISLERGPEPQILEDEESTPKKQKKEDPSPPVQPNPQTVKGALDNFDIEIDEILPVNIKKQCM